MIGAAIGPSGLPTLTVAPIQTSRQDLGPVSGCSSSPQDDAQLCAGNKGETDQARCTHGHRIITESDGMSPFGMRKEGTGGLAPSPPSRALACTLVAPMGPPQSSGLVCSEAQLLPMELIVGGQF